MVSKWHQTKSTLSLNGLYLAKSKTFNLSSVSATSIDNYLEITIPLTRLTRKKAPWQWTSQCQLAFDTLKQAFTEAPILSHWVPNRQLIIETDASDYAFRGHVDLT